MSHSQLVKLLAGVRLAIGVGAWVAPRPALKALSLNPQANPQLPYLARIAGARDIALAVGTLAAHRHAQRNWLIASLASDTADAAAGIAAGTAGYLPPLSAALVTASGAGAALLGVLALDRP